MYLEHIPQSQDNTITAGSIIDAMVEYIDHGISAVCRNRKGIDVNDILRHKKVAYSITQIFKVGRTHLKIVAHEV